MLRWRRPFGLRDERPIGAIPRWVTAGFVALLALQIVLRAVSPAPRAAAVDLPDEVDRALVDQGVFVRALDGLEVRVSRSGDQIFVLLSDAPTASAADTSI